MKISLKKPAQKSKRSLSAVSRYPNLPFEHQDNEDEPTTHHGGKPSKEQKIHHIDNKAVDDSTPSELAESFQSEGNKLAEDGRYKEALGKWEAALTLMPDRAVLHEQKAQVLLEIGDAWNALKAATRATELEPSWAEGWITLARTQLNFGEPDTAIESFDRALAIKPDSKDAQDDRQTAVNLVKRRKRLQLSGLCATENRYVVGDTSSACENMDNTQM